MTAPSWNPPVTPHVRMWQGRPQFRRRLMTPWPKPLTLCGAEATAHDVLRSDLPRIKRAGEVDRVCGLCMEQA